MMRYSRYLLFAAIGLQLTAGAQTSKTLKEQFPAADAVYTNLLCHVDISMNNENKLVASSRYEEDLVFLTDNSVRMMSRGRIYHSSFNTLGDWTAYTKLPDNKKLKIANTTTNSSTQNYIFYDDAKATSFDYSGATLGATRHLEYVLQHNDPHLLTPHYFDRYFPVANGELRISFPSSVKIRYVVKGVSADKVQFSESRKKDKTIYTFSVSNFSASPDYPDAPDNSYYATHVVFFIEKVLQNNQWQNFLATPDDLYRFVYPNIKNLNATVSDELKQLTDSVTRTAKNDREKAASIYRWVQNNIKYIAFEDGMEGFVPRDASLICSRRFGDCKDMTSILTAMLRHAGIPAYFTWIGTRDIPYTYEETPLPVVDNHMICTIRLGDELIYLDGTDNGCAFGMPPYSIQGKEAMIGISEKEYKIAVVPVIDKSKNIFTDSTILHVVNNELNGRIRIDMTGYWASELFTSTNYRNASENETYFKQRFARGSNKVQFSNWKFHIDEDRSRAWVTADIVAPGIIKVLDNEIFLNLNLFRWFEHKEIDIPKRNTPIEQDFLNRFFYVTSLKIPEGYKISYLPEGQAYTNDVWGFRMVYKGDARQVSLDQQFDTNQLLMQPHQFESWNKVLENLLPHYKQSTALQKK